MMYREFVTLILVTDPLWVQFSLQNVKLSLCLRMWQEDLDTGWR